MGSSPEGPSAEGAGHHNFSHLLYFREGDQQSQGGLWFLVNKSLFRNVVEVSSISNRVTYFIVKLDERYSLKVTQV